MKYPGSQPIRLRPLTIRHPYQVLRKAALASILVAAFLADTGAAEVQSGQDPEAFGKTLRGAYVAALAGTLLPVGMGAVLVSAGDDEVAGAGGVLLAGGILLGPSTGQFYAGSIGHGLLSTGVRTLGAVLLLSGAINRMPSMSCLEREPGEAPCEPKNGLGLAILGGATFLGGAIYSLVETRFAVVRHRRDVERAAFSIAPTLALTRGGAMRRGAMVSLRF